MAVSLETVLKNDNERALRDKVHAAVHDFPSSKLADVFSKEERHLFGYPAFLSAKIKDGSVGPDEKGACAEKLGKLEKIINDIVKGKLKEDGDDLAPEDAVYRHEYSGKTDIDYFNEILFSKTHGRYTIDMFDPAKDDAKMIKKMVRGVGMCWPNDEYGYLTSMIVADAKLNGGTIIYAIRRPKRTAAVVRDFIGLDGNGNSYLFIDTVEGWDKPGVSHHDIDRWAEKEPGALKLAILSSLYLAKKIGVDYVAAGDEPVKRMFQAIGATKIRTSIGKNNYKIGYPAEEYPKKRESWENDEVDDRRVKSYFFHDEKNYSIILSSNFSKKEKKNRL